MSVRVDILPWPALQLRESDIPWAELRALANAAVQSGEVRHRLKRELDQLLEKRYADNEESFDDLTDLAVPAVFALAAERLDQAGRDDAARYLIELLYRAGKEDDDFLLEVVQSTVGRFGPALIEPAIRLIEAHGSKLSCWHFVWSLLGVAKDAAPETKQRVINLCMRMLRELPDRFEPYSDADAPAWLLADLAPEKALPLIKSLAGESQCPELLYTIDDLEGREPQLEPILSRPWIEPVEEWLPRQLRAVREWFERRDSDDKTGAYGDESQWVDSDVDGEEDEPSNVLHLFDGDRDGNGLSRSPIRRSSRTVGRNEPCPCGSGKKFKKCCGRIL